jgi:anti-repressor protein
MNELTAFHNSEFGELHITEIDNRPHFPGTRCAEILGYSNPRKAIIDHCPHVTKRDVGVQTGISADGTPAFQTVSKSIIPEGDLYHLIVRSNLPTAERFEHWVFDEVLPSIRKHSAYITPDKIEEILLNPDTLIRLATDLKSEREKTQQLESARAVDKPKVIFADAVSASKETILIGDLAKILKGNGVNIGQNRLFERLRNEGYLIKRKGTDYNSPTQRSMELGLFCVKETAITHSDGHITISKTTKVTGKGQQYFINLFLKEQGEGNE